MSDDNIQHTIRKFFPAMSLHETMLHILFAKQEKGVIEPDRNMKTDYAGTIDDLIEVGLITRNNNNLKFTEIGLQKIENLRDIRGLAS